MGSGRESACLDNFENRLWSDRVNNRQNDDGFRPVRLPQTLTLWAVLLLRAAFPSFSAVVLRSLSSSFCVVVHSAPRSFLVVLLGFLLLFVMLFSPCPLVGGAALPPLSLLLDGAAFRLLWVAFVGSNTMRATCDFLAML